MADPEELLGALPDESPPPEIVLAAVRVFRYRALAAVAIGIALVLAGAFVLQQINVNGQFPVKVATALVQGGEYGGEGIGDVHTVDGLSVVVWEVYGAGSAANPDTLYVHVVGWDPKGRDLFVEVTDVTYGDLRVGSTEQRQGGSRDGATTLLDVWFGVELPPPELTPVFGPLRFDADMVRLRDDRVVATVPFEVKI